MPTPPARAVRATLRHRWPALLLLAVAVLLAGAAPGTVTACNAAVVAAELRSAVGLLPADERALRVTTNSADDAEAQLAAATAVVEAAEDAGLGRATVRTARFTYPLDAAAPGGGPAARVVLAASADWGDRVDVVDGRAPAAGPVPEVLAPRASGLATGDELLVGAGATPVRVVGTWAPRADDDPFWFADPGVASGTMTDRDGAVGPLFVADDATVDALAERPLVRWTVVPDLADSSVAALGAAAAALDALPQALRDAGVLVQGATVEDEAAAQLGALAVAGTAERDRGAPPTVVAGAAGVLAVLAAAWGLAARTARERAVLAARGGTARGLVTREAPGVLGACALGAASAVAVVALSARGVGTLAGAGVPGAAGALGCAAALVLASRTRPVGGRTTPAGRGPSVGLAAVLGVLTVLGGVTAWLAAQAARAEGPAGAAGPLAATRPAAAALLLALAGALVAVLARAVRPAIGHGVVPAGGALALAAGAATLALEAPPGSASRATWAIAASAALAALALVVVADRATARWDLYRDAPHVRRRGTTPVPVLAAAAVLVLAGGWAIGAALAALVLGGVAR